MAEISRAGGPSKTRNVVPPCLAALADMSSLISSAAIAHHDCHVLATSYQEVPSNHAISHRSPCTPPMPLSCSAARTQVHFFSTFSAFSTSRPTMLGSASVEVSPSWSASRHAIFRSTRRMILPAAERGGSRPAHSHIAILWLHSQLAHYTPRNAPRHSPCVISPCHILSSHPPPALFLTLPPLLFPSSSSFPCLTPPTSVLLLRSLPHAMLNPSSSTFAPLPPFPRLSGSSASLEYKRYGPAWQDLQSRYVPPAK